MVNLANDKHICDSICFDVVLETPSGIKTSVKILKNPSIEYIKQQINYIKLRFLVDKEQNIYVWNAEQATHEMVVMNLFGKENVILLGIFKNNEIAINSGTMIENYDYSFFDEFAKDIYGENFNYVNND